MHNTLVKAILSSLLALIISAKIAKTNINYLILDNYLHNSLFSNKYSI